MRFRLASILAITLLAWPHAAAGSPQDPETRDAPAPAHVAYVEGTATLERDGRPENAPLNMPLLSGDRLKTGDGRVEVLFADGSALHMDSRTTIDLQADDLLRLIDGRLRLTIAGSGEARSASLVYRVDSPAGSVRITQPGDYRVSMLRRGEEVQLEIAVLRGAGELFTDEGTTPVRAGERAYASAGLAPSYAYTYNSANWDAFDRWSESRRDTRRGVWTN
jgi:ferric-dicitrate binding protein FerR (iron transport regulator)